MNGNLIFNKNASPISYDREGHAAPIAAASRELLRRQLGAGQHQITCPVRFRAVVEGLGL